jgi:TPP-dependent pyruvate/acetoin dehydrogenase alpha subunit
MTKAPASEADLDAYRRMLTIRRVEEATNRLFLDGKVHGSTHLAVGHEAVSVGVVGALGPKDLVSATYRGHGHAIALGVDPRGLLAEMTGRATGTCGGRSGSMNVIDLDHQLVGCFGIVGGSIGAATGVALGLKLDGEGAVSVAFFGDGATNQGYFLESLNLAAVLDLPVLYVCENNQYAEYTAMRDGTANGILPRAAAFGFPVQQVDGNDVWAVRNAAESLVEGIRRSSRPALLLCETYRFSGHGRGDPIEYRPAGELEAWRLRDPLAIVRNRLVAGGLEEDVVQVEQQVADLIDEAARQAVEDPWPEPTGLPGYGGDGHAVLQGVGGAA